MKKIIILDKIDDNNNKPTFRYIMWADVPRTRWLSFANSGATTLYTSATLFEKNALKSGMIVELANSFTIPINTNFTGMRGELINAFNQFQSEVSGGSKNIWERYGTCWDGNSWANSGVN